MFSRGAKVRWWVGFWLVIVSGFVWTFEGCKYAQYSNRENGSHGYLMGAVGTMKSQGKSQEGSHKGSLELYAELERVGYAPPIHVVQLLCPEHYEGLQMTQNVSLVLQNLWKWSACEKIGFLLQKVKWSSKLFALHCKALVHVQNVSVFMSLPTLILLACSQFVQRKKGSKVSSEWFWKPSGDYISHKLGERNNSSCHF